MTTPPAALYQLTIQVIENDPTSNNCTPSPGAIDVDRVADIIDRIQDLETYAAVLDACHQHMTAILLKPSTPEKVLPKARRAVRLSDIVSGPRK